VKSIRYLQVTTEPNTNAISTPALYEVLAKKTAAQDHHLREVVLSFASGSFASFMVIMVAMLVMRSRHGAQIAEGTPEGEALTGRADVE